MCGRMFFFNFICFIILLNINFNGALPNSDYERIGKAFVQHYYSLFDDPKLRASLVGVYSPTDAALTFEGTQLQGATNIKEKLTGLIFEKISRETIAIDCQPMTDGGILINVLGKMKSDEDPQLTFFQTFVLKTMDVGGFKIAHDIFRLVDGN